MSTVRQSSIVLLTAKPGIHEVGPGRYIVDASDLGLAPGEWPNLFAIEDRPGVGGQLWSFEGNTTYGDSAAVRYRSGDAALVVVGRPSSGLAAGWEPPAVLVEAIKAEIALPRCRVCSSTIIGTELAYGTCGQCGGRSLEVGR